MNPIVILGDADTVLAFALGGIRGYTAQSLEQARAAWHDLFDEQSTRDPPGLVLVTHAVATHLRDELAQVRRLAIAPLVVEIRGFAEPPQESTSARLVGRMLRAGR